MMVLDIENLKDARITLTLIFINILSFFLFVFALPEALMIFVQFNRYIIYNYEVWRLFTSIFMHADPTHLQGASLQVPSSYGLLFSREPKK